MSDYELAVSAILAVSRAYGAGDKVSDKVVLQVAAEEITTATMTLGGDLSEDWESSRRILQHWSQV
jgi:hypothetical protein